MKSEELLDALNQIDPEYIEEAEQFTREPKRKGNWIGYAALAASVCICLAAGSHFLLNEGAKGGDTASDSAKMETVDGIEEGKSNMGGVSETIPEEIHVDEDCYKRIDSTQEYQEEALTCVGELGDEDSNIYADSDLTGVKVYKIDENRIMVEIKGKYYTYKK